MSIRGSILVEVVLLVPILLVLILAVAYLDRFGRARVCAHEAARWLANRDAPKAPEAVEAARRDCFRRGDIDGFRVARDGVFRRGEGGIPMDRGPFSLRFLRSFLNAREVEVEIRHPRWPFPGRPEGPSSGARYVVDLPKAPGTWYRRYLGIDEPPGPAVR